jgi:hypothetical protein
MESTKIFSDHLAGFERRVHHDRCRRSATQRLDGQISGSGKKIQHPGAGKIMGENVKERLFYSRRGRARRLPFGHLETPTARISSDNSHVPLSLLSEFAPLLIHL